MDAVQTCEIILKHVKDSSLNFNLTESPFSVIINIKKSFIKDRIGTERNPKLGLAICHDSCTITTNRLVEKIKQLKATTADYENENEELKKVMHDLSMKL